MLVAETFQITGRGLVVAVDEATDLPTGKRLTAEIVKPDGSSIITVAFKESLLRRSTEPLEKEAFLLMGMSKEDVPIGSELMLTVAP